MHLYWIFILGKLYASLLFPFLLLQLFSGERVAVVVSGQQAEVAIFLRVKVEPRQLWQQNRRFITTARYLVSVLPDTQWTCSGSPATDLVRYWRPERRKRKM